MLNNKQIEQLALEIGLDFKNFQRVTVKLDDLIELTRKIEELLNKGLENAK